jgi:hypothetical protein
LTEVTVSAGDSSRDHTIVAFDTPAGARQASALRDAEGVLHPVQVDDDGTATFILTALAAGEEQTFALVQSTATAVAGATAAVVDDVIRLSIDDGAVVDTQLNQKPREGVEALTARGGYLHPLVTPGGVAVTDDYPEDHAHHHGIWTAWARARFNGREVDFWNVQSKQGRVELDRVRGIWQGPVHSGLDATLAHIALAEGVTTALNEHWVVRAYKTHQGAAPYNAFDLESTQVAATDSPIELLEYTYGGFGLRGHAQWRDVSNVIFLTSEGLGREAGEGQGARWCFMGGNVGGRPVGFAALGHPSNFRAPQTMRIHPTEPFMAFAPVKDGPFTIHPGTPYVTRFRFVTIDGAPDVALLDRLWNDYAKPPAVRVAATR